MGDRKARLAALAARAGRSKSAEELPNEEVGDIQDDDNHDGYERDEQLEKKIKPPIVFRNYTPKDASLLHPHVEESNEDGEEDDEHHNGTSSPSSTAPLPSGSPSSPSNKRPRPRGGQPLNNSNGNSSSNTATTTFTTKKPMTLHESLARAKQEIAHQMNGGGRLDHAAGAVATNVAALAPEKINGDLKRGIQHKLAKLERRTQKAIVAMLKDRLEQEAAAHAEEGDDNDENDNDENDLD